MKNFVFSIISKTFKKESTVSASTREELTETIASLNPNKAGTFALQAMQSCSISRGIGKKEFRMEAIAVAVTEAVWLTYGSW